MKDNKKLFHIFLANSTTTNLFSIFRMATKRDFDGKRKRPEAPGGSTDSGQCDFARFSQQTCRGKIVDLKSLSSTKQKAGIPEKTLILARCGFFKGAPTPERHLLLPCDPTGVQF